MRPSLWLFSALCLTIGCAAKPVPREQWPAAETVQLDVVEGFGETSEYARADALNKARKKVADWLLENYPQVWGYAETDPETREEALNKARDKVADWLLRKYPRTWSDAPRTEKDLANNKFVKLLGEPEAEQFPLAGNMKRVQLRVEIRPEQRADLLGKVRDEFKEQRQYLTGKVLIGLVALFAVVAGYLRLEEAMRGYYTRMLRLAAGGLVLFVVAGLLLVR
jgi:hypothetical protein